MHFICILNIFGSRPFQIETRRTCCTHQHLNNNDSSSRKHLCVYECVWINTGQMSFWPSRNEWEISNQWTLWFQHIQSDLVAMTIRPSTFDKTADSLLFRFDVLERCSNNIQMFIENQTWIGKKFWMHMVQQQRQRNCMHYNRGERTLAMVNWAGLVDSHTYSRVVMLSVW